MMKTVFYSDMSEPDPRWKTRRPFMPDLPVGDFAPKYNRDGRLVLRLREGDNQVYTSHVGTLDQAFLYGNFEARMRFLGPQGAHSAFWLQDVEPDSVGGCEVDVVEHFGSDTTVQNNLHWRTPESVSSYNPETWHGSFKTSPRDWHVYGCNWTENGYVFTVDGKAVNWTTEGASSKPKVMILSLLSSKWEWPRLQRDNLDAYRTMVDWVRVKQEVLT